MKILGVSVVTLLLIVAAMVIGRAYGGMVPLLNNVPAG